MYARNVSDDPNELRATSCEARLQMLTSVRFIAKAPFSADRTNSRPHASAVCNWTKLRSESEKR
ncbi:hypothetical protein EGYY_22350 [Eggerthella sp. YY7918]|nr:hypothetical protein EGYY_22350 [Eggerthella sp. YY7918]